MMRQARSQSSWSTRTRSLRTRSSRTGVTSVPNAESTLDPASPLWDMPNVLISPHTASHSLGQNEAIFEIFLENLARFRSGQKLRNDVDDLG